MDNFRIYGLPAKTLFIYVMDDCNDTSSVMLITMDYYGIVIVSITVVPDSLVRDAHYSLHVDRYGEVYDVYDRSSINNASRTIWVPTTLCVDMRESFAEKGV